MLKMLDTTIQNLVTQDLCIPDLQIKRKQNIVVVLVTAPDIYTCQKYRMSESCPVFSIEYVRTSWAFKLVDLMSYGINTWSAVNGSYYIYNI